jgi:hypothetical protein
MILFFKSLRTFLFSFSCFCCTYSPLLAFW